MEPFRQDIKNLCAKLQPYRGWCLDKLNSRDKQMMGFLGISPERCLMNFFAQYQHPSQLDTIEEKELSRKLHAEALKLLRQRYAQFADILRSSQVAIFQDSKQLEFPHAFQELWKEMCAVPPANLVPTSQPTPPRTPAQGGIKIKSVTPINPTMVDVHLQDHIKQPHNPVVPQSGATNNTHSPQLNQVQQTPKGGVANPDYQLHQFDDQQLDGYLARLRNSFDYYSKLYEAKKEPYARQQAELVTHEKERVKQQIQKRKSMQLQKH